MHKIMIVDDEENILKALKRTLRINKNWTVTTFNHAEEALHCAMNNEFDLFISDYRMPEIDGVDFLTAVKKLQPDAIRIILSGYTELDALMGAINHAEIFRFITKPCDEELLIHTIEQALAYKDILVENKQLADQVRQQQKKLEKQKQQLNEYEKQHPDLLHVDWAEDGTIILDSQLK